MQLKRAKGSRNCSLMLLQKTLEPQSHNSEKREVIYKASSNDHDDDRIYIHGYMQLQRDVKLMMTMMQTRKRE